MEKTMDIIKTIDDSDMASRFGHTITLRKF
jgi:hypothetical protein